MTLENRHVLFVDSDVETLETVETLLEAEGVRVTTAESGQEALEHLQDGLSPDLIIADMVVLDVDGLNIIRTLRASKDWRSIPVVIVAPQHDRAALTRAMTMGADDYLIKPFDRERLMLLVQTKPRAIRPRAVPPAEISLPSPTNGRRELMMDISPTAPTILHRPAENGTAPLAAAASSDVGGELKTYARIIGRYKWVILVCAAVAFVAALLLTFLMTPIYAATATVRVSAASGGVVDYGTQSLATRLLNTYVEIALSDRLRDDVMARLNLERIPGIEVEPVPETELLHITATDPDPAVARDVANTLATIMVESSLDLYGGDVPTARELLEEQLNQAQEDLDAAVEAYDEALRNSQVVPSGATPMPQGQLDLLEAQVRIRQQFYADALQRYENARVNEVLRANAITIVEEAYEPVAPSSPKKSLNAMLGLFAGLGVGILLAFVLEMLDTSVRSIEEVQAMTAQPLLVQIPDMPRGLPIVQKPPSPLFAENKLSYAADVYHRLRVRLLMSGALPPHASLLVSSPEPGTGKSTVAANLALAMAQAGNRVVLVDMDLRRPSQQTIFDLQQQPGFSDIMRRETTLGEVLQDTAYPNLRVLTSGLVTDDLTGLATPQDLEAFIERVLDDCDYLVIDAPAVLANADTTVLAKLVDAMFLLVAQRHTDRSSLRLSLQHLREIGVEIIGVVVNRVPRSRLHSYSGNKPLPVIDNLREKISRVRQGATQR